MRDIRILYTYTYEYHSFKLLHETNCSKKHAAHGNCDQIRTVWERIIKRATEWNTLFKYARVRSTPTPEAHSIRRLMRGIKKPQAWRGLAWHINPHKIPPSWLPAGWIDVSWKRGEPIARSSLS